MEGMKERDGEREGEGNRIRQMIREEWQVRREQAKRFNEMAGSGEDKERRKKGR